MPECCSLMSVIHSSPSKNPRQLERMGSLLTENDNPPCNEGGNISCTLHFCWISGRYKFRFHQQRRDADAQIVHKSGEAASKDASKARLSFWRQKLWDGDSTWTAKEKRTKQKSRPVG